MDRVKGMFAEKESALRKELKAALEDTARTNEALSLAETRAKQQAAAAAAAAEIAARHELQQVSQSRATGRAFGRSRWLRPARSTVLVHCS